MVSRTPIAVFAHLMGRKIIRINKYVVVRLWFLVLVLLLALSSLVVLNEDLQETTISPIRNYLKSWDQVELDVSKMDPRDIPYSYRKFDSKVDKPFLKGGGCQVPSRSEDKANAALVVLSRNKELNDVVKSMKSLERHFNQWYNYPWVFLNDEPFDDEFRKTVARYTKSEIEFGLIPKKEWDFPEDVDAAELEESIESQGDRRIMYGNLESYHKMCRFYSGYFYEHELVKKRDWYWRVEPDVEFYCDITYDPFLQMEKNNKKYGFTVMINDLYYTLPGLFKETKKFIKKQESAMGERFKLGSLWKLFIHDSKITTGNYETRKKYDDLSNQKEVFIEMELNILTEKFLALENKKDSMVMGDGGVYQRIVDHIVKKMKSRPKLWEDRLDREEYNLCHFWSNFEIARTDLFNSPTYKAYFQHLDASGGFYKERWGDAPVHSLGVAMMLELDEVHYFRDIGYRHSVLSHCPKNSKNQLPYQKSDSYIKGLMTPKEEKHWIHFDKVNTNIDGGTGCRCKCPGNSAETEDKRNMCMQKWYDITRDDYTIAKPIDVDYWENEIRKRIDRHLKKGHKLGEDRVVV
ncbi:probable mannosyltransferase Ktr5p [[Candida] railenensis]|uniref:Probable mannosyltransferase Ktr5p n=1 Tax=[Candida] railenensis TaxID=45579 RepID=A0A9P0QP88_9ASCO|nr:probable mannosyltransferase Ktr5p [[Candida] railenensis]